MRLGATDAEVTQALSKVSLPSGWKFYLPPTGVSCQQGGDGTQICSPNGLYRGVYQIVGGFAVGNVGPMDDWMTFGGGFGTGKYAVLDLGSSRFVLMGDPPTPPAWAATQLKGLPYVTSQQVTNYDMAHRGPSTSFFGGLTQLTKAALPYAALFGGLVVGASLVTAELGSGAATAGSAAAATGAAPATATAPTLTSTASEVSTAVTAAPTGAGEVAAGTGATGAAAATGSTGAAAATGAASDSGVMSALTGAGGLLKAGGGVVATGAGLLAAAAKAAGATGTQSTATPSGAVATGAPGRPNWLLIGALGLGAMMFLKDDKHASR